MNTKNNKRKRESQKKIKEVFFDLVQKKELNRIKVSEICQGAKINRSTFYANYIDIYDLVDKLFLDMGQEIEGLFDEKKALIPNEDMFLKILTHIKNNQKEYKICFKLGYETRAWRIKFFDENILKSEESAEYRIEFFKGGFNAIIKKWIENNCIESPEEICNIFIHEYRGRLIER